MSHLPSPDREGIVALYAKFASVMETCAPFEITPVLAVAVSGGSDSMALLYLADHWAKIRGGYAIALIVDHGLRQESQQEALQVTGWLETFQIPCHILSWKGKKPTKNLQAIAREKRYELLTEWCKSHHILHLLLAHHADDQAETVMLRLLRGSGVDGLAAMSSLSSQNGVRLLRPLLNIPKQTLQSLLQQLHWPWVEDPSNNNPLFERVRIRKYLSAETDNTLTRRLQQTAAQLGRTRATLEAATAQAMVQCLTLFPEGYAALHTNRFNALPEDIALRLLSAVLRTVSGSCYTTRYSHLLGLYHAMNAPSFSGRTLHGCAIFPYKKQLLIARERSVIEKSAGIIPQHTMLWDHRFLLKISTTARDHLSYKATALSPLLWKAFQTEFPEILAKSVLSSLPKKILYTLPVVTALENIVAFPHINWIRTTENMSVLCHFHPYAPVSRAYFHYISE